MARITLNGIQHRYPGAPDATLKGIDLVINDGEAHALLGGSGAGKTTLLNVLSGLSEAFAGEICFDSKVVRFGERRNVAQVFQFPVLYEGLDVRGNLEFALKNAGWKRGARHERVADIAAKLEIADLLNRRPKDLTLFQKQLVAIGKALVRPDIALVLLDEPLTAVAPATKWRLRVMLKRIQRSLGMTMIYVTHDQTEALTFADRISVMDAGAIIQTDTAQALYERPLHEHVGYFIGSPGMSFLNTRVQDNQLWLADTLLGSTDAAPGLYKLGFRPEWARIVPLNDDHDIVLTVERTRIEHSDRGVPFGLMNAVCDGERLHTRQQLNEVGSVTLPAQAALKIDIARCSLYRDGWRVDGLLGGLLDGHAVG
ncbi:MAG: ABC transporter ATP-binding protein [Proteobacteria bacterium]|nr:ABC transporter ATP-binding protein [Pseudomonadota bacterium]